MSSKIGERYVRNIKLIDRIEQFEGEIPLQCLSQTARLLLDRGGQLGF